MIVNRQKNRTCLIQIRKMENNDTFYVTDKSLHKEEELQIIIIKAIWTVGILMSALAWFIQIFIFIRVSQSRIIDEIVLTQLSLARILNTCSEFVLIFETLNDPIARSALQFWNFYTDFVLPCWMFVFTKNLYDKVVSVFHQDWQKRIWTVTIVVWILPIPGAVIATYILRYNTNYFHLFFNIYCILKFIIVIINSVLFIVIFKISFTMNKSNRYNRKWKSLLRTIIVAFILSCVSFIQVLTTDILSIFNGSNMLIEIFCVLNSFQVVAVTDIFIVIVRNNCTRSGTNEVFSRHNPSISVTSSV